MQKLMQLLYFLVFAMAISNNILSIIDKQLASLNRRICNPVVEPGEVVGVGGGKC